MESIRTRLIDVIGGDAVDDLENNGKVLANKASKFAKSQCLPLGLLLGLIMSISIPVIGAYMDQGGYMAYVCIILIFLISGLKLQTAEWAEAMRSYKAISFSLLSILFITPLIGSYLTSLVKLEPPEFGLGLSIFFCSPCAINSAVVVSKQVVPASLLISPIPTESSFRQAETSLWHSCSPCSQAPQAPSRPL